MHRALGVPDGARKLDIDVAATRIHDHSPAIAAKAAVVAEVLTNRELRIVYQSLGGLRDRVCRTLADRHGDKLVEMIPDHRAVIWDKCCELLKFSLDRPDLPVGPRGSESLAELGEDWVVESVLTSQMPVLRCCGKDMPSGAVIRELWYATCPACGDRRKILCERKNCKSPPSAGAEEKRSRTNHQFDRASYNYYVGCCPKCRTPKYDPSTYDDTFTFRFPSESPDGTIVQGEGHRAGTVIYAILNSLPRSSNLREVLPDFYRLQQAGQDLTLYETDESLRPKRRRARVNKNKCVNPRAQLMCCLGCGRDTRDRLGFCGRCAGKIATRCAPDEEEGRSVWPSELFEDTPFEYDSREHFSVEQYHGYSRDDM